MKKQYMVAMLLVVIVAVWLFTGARESTVVSGQAEPASTESRAGSQAGSVSAGGSFGSMAEPLAATSELPLVRGVFSRAQPHMVELTVRGRTEVNRQVDVRAEVSGRVVALPVAEGSRVEAGELLCELAADARDQAVEEAEAMVLQAELEYAGALNLQVDGLQSEVAVAQAKANLEAARAGLERSRVAFANTRVVAPFAGVVQQQPVEMGDFLLVGDVCARVLDADPMLLVGQVAERDVGKVQVGEHLRAVLLDGREVEGRIRFVSQDADADTRAYRVEAEVDNAGFQLRGGMTAELRVPLGRRVAHRISPALLVLDDAGDVGVRTVDADNRVVFHVVEIVSEGPQGIHVAGLPEDANIITVGQETVFAGQQVRIDLSPLTSAVAE